MAAVLADGEDDGLENEAGSREVPDWWAAAQDGAEIAGMEHRRCDNPRRGGIGMGRKQRDSGPD